jgi:hypothetical protein
MTKEMRLKSRIIIRSLALITLFVAGSIPHKGSASQNPKSRVTEQDKAEIVRLTLADVLTPSSKLLSEKQSKGEVILSTKNIKLSWVPKVEGFDLVPLTPDEIRRKANREGDFEYLFFARIKVKGEKVIVELVNTWAKSRDSGMAYLSGGGLTLEYSKNGGKWVSRFITGYVS